MALVLKHTKVLSKSDGLDSTVVQPSDWNASHTLTAAAGKVLGTLVGSTTVTELPIAVDGSNNVSLSGSLTGTNLNATQSGVNANVVITSNGGSGRQWLLVSNTSGGFSIYDGTGAATRVWVSPAGLVGIGTTSPSDPLTVNGVIKSLTGGFSYPDGTTQTTAANTPTGALLAYAGAAAPSGWLLCAGQEVSRSTYSALFAIIGTTYGAGNGSTTFNVPDLRGRVAAGKDDMGGSSAARLNSMASTSLGAVGGNQSHTLAVAELPAHTHLTVGTTSGTLSDTTAIRETASYSSNNNYDLAGSSSWSKGLTSATGSNSPHNNVQPTIIMNYIIKA